MQNPWDKPDKEKTVVVGYIRVSTETQIDNYGLDVQKDAIQFFIGKNPDIQLLKIYEDAGISGTTIEERPALLQLLADAQLKQFARVIVPKLDRVARDTFACLWIEKELRKYGVELFSISEPFRWDDPAQKVFLQIISSFAEFERARIQERLFSGLRKKVSCGGFGGGQIARGYKSLNGELIPDASESKIVQRIFSMRNSLVKGKPMTMQKIADTLNSENIPSCKGKKWYSATIQYILANKIYQGEIKYGGIRAKGIHIPILPQQKEGSYAKTRTNA